MVKGADLILSYAAWRKRSFCRIALNHIGLALDISGHMA
jgi:hypothetical protein